MPSDSPARPMLSNRIVIALEPDDAQDLYDMLLFRPHDERWSDDVLAALRKAGVEPTAVPTAGLR